MSESNPSTPTKPEPFSTSLPSALDSKVVASVDLKPEEKKESGDQPKQAEVLTFVEEEQKDKSPTSGITHPQVWSLLAEYQAIGARASDPPFVEVESISDLLYGPNKDLTVKDSLTDEDKTRIRDLAKTLFPLLLQLGFPHEDEDENIAEPSPDPSTKDMEFTQTASGTWKGPVIHADNQDSILKFIRSKGNFGRKRKRDGSQTIFSEGNDS